jgi:hypothetical protein
MFATLVLTAVLHQAPTRIDLVPRFVLTESGVEGPVDAGTPKPFASGWLIAGVAAGAASNEHFDMALVSG